MSKQPAALRQYWASKRRGKRSRSRAMTRSPRRSPARRRRYARRAARVVGGAALGGLLPIGIAAAGLAYMTGPNGPESVRTFARKIPGTATFGPAATLGIACLAANHFVKANRWLKLVGVAGLVLGAAQVGTKGSSFKWVGDDDMGDIEDVEDVEDVEGDDDY